MNNQVSQVLSCLQGGLDGSTIPGANGMIFIVPAAGGARAFVTDSASSLEDINAASEKTHWSIGMKLRCAQRQKCSIKQAAK